MTATADWLDYWSGDVSLYVSPRHLEAHYRGLFEAVRPLLPPAPFTLLDYGCGEALMAPRLAGLGGRVLLHDAAPPRAEALRRRFAAVAGVEVAEDLEAHAGAADLVLLVSVLQYVPKREAPALFARLARVLKPGGRLVVGDILAPTNSVKDDVLELLRFGRREGFLLQALAGLVRTLKSDYGRMRGRIGLTTWTLPELIAALAEAGFAAEPLGWNIGHAHHRHSLVATKRA